MRIVITLVLIFICVTSCKKEEKTYYPDGTLKTVVGISNSRFHGPFKAFYENGELQSEANYAQGLIQGLSVYYHKPEHKFSKSEMLFRNDTAYYRWDYDKSGKLVEEGSLEENSKTGKWIYYDIEENYTKTIREVFYLNDKSHLNQTWELNRQGDTIGGNYYEFIAENPLDLSNQVVRFRIDRLPYFENSELYVCIRRKESEPFNSDFSNEKRIMLDTIANLVIGHEKTNTDEIVVDLKYETPGKKLLRGYLLEKKSQAEGETLDFVTRKIYFEKEIYIKDRSEDNSTFP
jgi:hypothetical protein